MDGPRTPRELRALLRKPLEDMTPLERTAHWQHGVYRARRHLAHWRRMVDPSLRRRPSPDSRRSRAVGRIVFLLMQERLRATAPDTWAEFLPFAWHLAADSAGAPVVVLDARGTSPAAVPIFTWRCWGAAAEALWAVFDELGLSSPALCVPACWGRRHTSLLRRGAPAVSVTLRRWVL